jgi:type IV pilus assembly protein PilA
LTRRAFTLIELMIVVAIIGILAVLAVYGVRKYIAHTKTAEARNALGRMANSAAIGYENEHMSGSVMTQGSTTNLSRALCLSASAPVPGSISQVTGKKYQSSWADWNADATVPNKGFSCLRFTIDQPQYYVYSYTLSGTGVSPGDSFTGTANGDLNGDGIASTFVLTGKINSDYSVNIAPNIQETNPEE